MGSRRQTKISILRKKILIFVFKVRKVFNLVVWVDFWKKTENVVKKSLKWGCEASYRRRPHIGRGAAGGINGRKNKEAMLIA